MSENRRKLVVLATAFAVIAAPLVIRAPTASGVGPAQVSPFSGARTSNATYDYLNRDGSRGQATWRISSGTGNCCENYLAATPTGRLLNFGDGRLRFSDDLGQSWKTVHTNLPALIGEGGEGAVVVGPNGDVIGAQWDLAGDRVQTFKYVASSGTWEWSESPLHTPFYDRPWLSVVPGPFTVAGQSHPYMSILKGGWPSKDIWYYSFDGLHYVLAGSKMIEEHAAVPGRRELPSTPDGSLDYTQPHTVSGVTPLPGGGAIAADLDLLNLGQPFAIMHPPVPRWEGFELVNPRGPGRALMDSRGRLHHISAYRPPGSQAGFPTHFTYSMSRDGGKTWVESHHMLPSAMYFEEWDFKVNGALGIAALGIHAHESVRNMDQDLLYQFDVAGNGPVLDKLHFVGDGLANFGIGVTSSLPRYDFASVAILPNGSIATSMVDSKNHPPVIAILVPGHTPAPAPSSSGTPGPNPSVPPPNPDPSVSPSASPSGSPTAPSNLKRHERGILLRLERHLVAKGRLTTRSGPMECVEGAQVTVERRVRGVWKAIATDTSYMGRFRVRLPDRGGRYRATVVEEVSETDICAAGVSKVVTHTH